MKHGTFIINNYDFTIDPKKYKQIYTTINELKTKYGLILGIAQKVEAGNKYKYELIFWVKNKKAWNGWRKAFFINEILAEIYKFYPINEIFSRYNKDKNDLEEILIEYRITKQSFSSEEIVSYGKLVDDLEDLEKTKKEFEKIQKGEKSEIGTGDTIPKPPEKKKTIFEQLSDVFKNATHLVLVIAVLIAIFAITRFIKK